jgi:hypothetical protein
MKKAAAWLLCVLLLPMGLSAMGEGAGPALPVDGSPGPAPNPAGYVSETAYEDESISVQVESRKIGDGPFARPGFPSPRITTTLSSHLTM